MKMLNVKNGDPLYFDEEFFNALTTHLERIKVFNHVQHQLTQNGLFTEITIENGYWNILTRGLLVGSLQLLTRSRSTNYDNGETPLIKCVAYIGDIVKWMPDRKIPFTQLLNNCVISQRVNDITLDSLAMTTKANLLKALRALPKANKMSDVQMVFENNEVSVQHLDKEVVDKVIIQNTHYLQTNLREVTLDKFTMDVALTMILESDGKVFLTSVVNLKKSSRNFALVVQQDEPYIQNIISFPTKKF